VEKTWTNRTTVQQDRSVPLGGRPDLETVQGGVWGFGRQALDSQQNFASFTQAGKNGTEYDLCKNPHLLRLFWYHAIYEQCGTTSKVRLVIKPQGVVS
jgi:hypothetical protein